MAKLQEETLVVVDKPVISIPEPEVLEVLDTTPSGSITLGSNEPGTYTLANGTQVVNF